jgi:hypothetical protein
MTTVCYESTLEKASHVSPGVRYTIDRMSFGRRLELMRAVREITYKMEFQAAGGETGQMDAAILSAEVDRLYLRWGLRKVEGLMIDGVLATPDALALTGPEDLFQEALAIVKAECTLTPEEKKT